jgi:hypothetical protein
LGPNGHENQKEEVNKGLFFHFCGTSLTNLNKGLKQYDYVNFKLSKTKPLTPTKSKNEIVNNGENLFVDSTFGLSSFKISLKQNTIYHERK